MEAPHIVRDWPNFSWIQLDILDMVLYTGTFKSKFQKKDQIKGVKWKKKSISKIIDPILLEILHL